MCQTLSDRVLGLPDSDFPNYPYNDSDRETEVPALVECEPWHGKGRCSDTRFTPLLEKMTKGTV